MFLIPLSIYLGHELSKNGPRILLAFILKKVMAVLKFPKIESLADFFHAFFSTGKW